MRAIWDPGNKRTARSSRRRTGEKKNKTKKTIMKSRARQFFHDLIHCHKIRGVWLPQRWISQRRFLLIIKLGSYHNIIFYSAMCNLALVRNLLRHETSRLLIRSHSSESTLSVLINFSIMCDVTSVHITHVLNTNKRTLFHYSCNILWEHTTVVVGKMTII